MKGKKKWFLRVLEISLMLFVALFFMANSVQAQTSNNNFNFLYDYGDFFTNYGNLFTNSNSWFSFPSFDYQNNFRYGQSNFGGWSQSNIPSFSALWQTPNYFSYNQNQPLYGLDYASSARTNVSYNGYGWNQPFLFNGYGGPPLIPYYSLDGPLFGHDNTKDPYASDALWNLNWDLEDTDITLNNPGDGESITVHAGETMGFILPNHGDNYDADIEWVLDEDELDENIVEKISDERFPGYWYNGGVRPVFENGVEQWIFEAIGTGSTTIKLDCINREDDNTGTIEIKVKVIN